jgi:double-stranded uracil-DNA glycosylase
VRIFSFPPLMAVGARVLILGSMPGVASLQAGQYYAHPRNQFWRILEQLCNQEEGPSYEGLSYAQRLTMLRQHHLAVWDVLHSCVRPGSLDSAIEQPGALPNALIELLRKAPAMVRICCNGSTAHRALQRHFGQALAQQFPQIEIHRLPSTSPAHASWTFARKLAAWREGLRPALQPHS